VDEWQRFCIRQISLQSHDAFLHLNLNCVSVPCEVSHVASDPRSQQVVINLFAEANGSACLCHCAFGSVPQALGLSGEFLTGPSGRTGRLIL
jgi:hypothetical protein